MKTTVALTVIFALFFAITGFIIKYSGDAMHAVNNLETHRTATMKDAPLQSAMVKTRMNSCFHSRSQGIFKVHPIKS